MVRTKRKSRNYLWLAIVVVVILAIAGGVYYYQTTTAQATVKAAATAAPKTATVKKGNITITASGTATLIPVTEVGLGFRSGGQIAIN